MDIQEQTGRSRQSQTETKARQRLEDIAKKGLNDPDALSRVEILDMCKMVVDGLVVRDGAVSAQELERRREAAATMVRLSQELGLE